MKKKKRCTKMSNKFIKNFDSLTLDFNNFFEMISKGDYKSVIKNKYIVEEQVFRSIFCIENLHSDKFFSQLIQKLAETYQLKNVKLDGFVFLSFLQGNSGTIHQDNYDVYLYNLFGETMYIVDGKKFILEARDLLQIKAGEVHQSITIKPRITFSLGVRNDF